MTVLALRRFGGVRPRASARLLANEEATTALNVKLWNGKLRPFRQAKAEFTTVKAGPIISIFKYRGGGKEGWFHFNTDVDVVRAPLAGDNFGRVYFTGSGKPKVTDSTMAVAITRLTVTTSTAGQGNVTIAGPQRGFLVGDLVRVTYSPGVFQDVTLSAVTPSSGNLILGFAPNLTGNVDVGDSVTNLATRFPLDALELGVPAPPSAPLTNVAAGPGVTGGAIMAVNDIELIHHTATETGTVAAIQNGTSPATGKHELSEDFSVTSDGQPIEFTARTGIAVKLNGFDREARDMAYTLVLNPGATPETIFTTNNHIVRPSIFSDIVIDSPNDITPDRDWEYFVTANGVHVPAAGAHNYRFKISPIAGIAGDNNNSYTVTIVWDIKVRYTNRIKLTLNTGHGLEAGDRITLHIDKTPETPVDRDLNNKIVEVISVSGDDVIVSGLPGGVYNRVGATWTQTTAVDEELVSRSYVYTYVAAISGQEFEGPPSPASPVVDVADGQPVVLSGFVNPTTPTLLRDTNFTAIRVYRFQPNDAGGGSYLFLSEQALTVVTVNDQSPGTALGELLPSLGWELPPDNLTGLIELPEGGAVGFTDKELCFAVPYQLHAYPAAYRRTTHDKIVAIGAFGSSVAVATEGTPYVLSGTDPIDMTSERLEIIQPCLSKRGAVDLGYAFMYPSPEGGMFLSTSRAEVVTDEFFTADEWRLLNPASFVATRYGQRYLCFYDATSLETLYPSDSLSYIRPLKGGFIFDPKADVGRFVFLDFWASEAWTDPSNDRVYIVQDGIIKEFDQDRLEVALTWRSKPFVFPAAQSMAIAAVEAKSYPLKFTVLADGEVLHTQAVRSSAPFRVPDGLYSSWAVEVQSEHEVEAIYLASSVEDLAQAQGGA